MGEGHRGEAQAPVSLCLERRGQAIGTTNHKGEPLVAQLFKASCEGNRGQGVALFHQGDQGFVGPQGRPDRLCLFIRSAVPQLADG